MSSPSHSRHIRRAYLTSLTEGVVELNRDWKPSRMPPIDLEGKPHGHLSLHALPASDYAKESGYYIEDDGLVVFVFFPDKYPSVEYEEVSIFVAGGFNEWELAVGNEDWELTPEKIGNRSALVLRKSVDDFSCNNGCQFKFVTDKHHWFGVNMEAPNLKSDGMGNWNYVFQPKRSGRHRMKFTLESPIEISENNALLYHTRKGVNRYALNPGQFILNLSSDKELGALLENDRVTFRLFAPRARWVKIGFFKDLADSESITWLLMNRGDDFVWEATVEEDLGGWYYWYRLDGADNEFSHFNPEFNILDPYAKAVVGREGPGIVLSNTNCRGQGRSNFKAPQWQDLVILEGHVRDFVAKRPSSGSDGGADASDAPHGFADLTKYAKTDNFYPKTLGVNAIELQPIQENDSQSYGEYHWGYMTTNFFAPHSGYASDPAKASQVDEFRELVATLHEQGLAVILDVVYNHVGEPAHLMYIDKSYYFHLGANGEPTNWSGCGNDLRTEAPMTRRLIVDSLKYLVEEYGVDGFRFDLADLVGKPVLQEVERELKAIRSDIILIAEPWSFRGHIGSELRDTGYASWNDGYREFLKRFVRGESGMDAIKYFLKGSPGHYASWPAQTVNYVESHDDRVWIDEITENSDFDGTRPTGNDVARTRLMAAMLFMSIGMPMLHAGMDFLVTKNGVRNTYQDGERNGLDYRRALEFSGCGQYFRDWIAFRRSETGGLVRHYSRAPEGFFEFIESENGVSFACIYNASGEWGDRKLLFAANPTDGSVELALGKWAELNWRQIADHERFLQNADEQNYSNKPAATLYLPRISCGLWEC